VGRDISIIPPAEIFTGILEIAIIRIKERALLYERQYQFIVDVINPTLMLYYSYRLYIFRHCLTTLVLNFHSKNNANIAIPDLSKVDRHNN